MKQNLEYDYKLELDFYEDLDVVMDGKIKIVDGDCSSIILVINNKEIEIEGQLANEIYDAIEIRVNNKLELLKEKREMDIVEMYPDMSRGEFNHYKHRAASSF